MRCLGSTAAVQHLNGRLLALSKNLDAKPTWLVTGRADDPSGNDLVEFGKLVLEFFGCPIAKNQRLALEEFIQSTDRQFSEPFSGFDALTEYLGNVRK